MTEHHRVVVVGSGFAGICTVVKLKESGRDDVVVLERGDDVGGTWRENTYPGAACDVPSHLYSLSFAPNPDWSRSFSPQPEIHAYLRRVAEDHDVLRHVRFGTELLAAEWEPEAQRWRLSTSTGELTCDVLVSATGGFAAPSVPELPGLESFQGKAFHSARWDHSWSAAGSRVAVIGTGASAIQVVPAIQPDVEHLTLFQRTPPWVMPKRDRVFGAAERRIYRRFPAVQRAARASIYWGNELRLIGYRYQRAILKVGERIARRHLEQQVPDPELRAKLTPDFDLGCKRVLLSNEYYPALTRPNAAVVTDRIVEVVPEGVVTEAADGTRTTHEVDTLVFCTGFHMTDQPIAETISAGGQTLAKRWAAEGMQALRGITVAGAPNLFMLTGPNTALGHNSMVIMIEAHVRYLVSALDVMDREGWAVVEPRAEVQDAYNAALQRDLSKTVWSTGGCRSWYMDDRGRNTLIWPDFTWRFVLQQRHFDASEYVVQPRRPALTPA